MRLYGEVAFHGLIQHSFALRMQGDPRPYHGMDPSEVLSELFRLPAGAEVEFRMHPVSSFLEGSVSVRRDPSPPFELPSYSPLVKNGLTTLEPQEIAFLKKRDHRGRVLLPKPLQWAVRHDEKERWERFIFAQNEQGEGKSPRLNDFLLETPEQDARESEAHSVSRVLCQLLAHRRSMLFGLSLASRFFNVMLPHALLMPARAEASGTCRETRDASPTGSWILQPLVSLIRAGGDGSDFQRTFSLTFFLIPVNSAYAHRKMPADEIAGSVQAEWSLASSRSPDELRQFRVSGPLPTYISHIERAGLEAPPEASVGAPASGASAFGDEGGPVTLRKEIEAILFAVALRMAQGPDGCAEEPLRQRIGDDIVTSLSNSRVSSVVAVDPRLTKMASRLIDRGKLFPGSLKTLMTAISDENRTASRKRYRIDRPFYDSDDTAIGVLPANRCIVFTTAKRSQRGSDTSGLMQAGWIAYMAIGASVAISTMRSIYRDLERADLSEPSAIARIEREVAVDLDEIYDLDITWEAYRHRYRLLRDRLGITSDYEALHSKLQAFYRETEAHHEARMQKRLMWLTAAIVVLSVLILVGTIAK